MEKRADVLPAIGSVVTFVADVRNLRLDAFEPCTDDVNVLASNLTQAADGTTAGTGTSTVVTLGTNFVVAGMSPHPDVSSMVAGILTARTDGLSSRTDASSSCTDVTSLREFIGPVCKPLILSTLG
jgi:hypothetical protein